MFAKKFLHLMLYLSITTGVLLTLVYSGGVSVILLKVIDMVLGSRVTEEEVRQGIDIELHGEHVA
jgi:Amt family ammonium transporter